MPAPANLAGIIDDGLTERREISVAQIINVLLDGPDSARTSSMQELELHLTHCPRDTLDSLLPMISDQCHNWSPLVQKAVAEALSITSRAICRHAKRTSIMAFRAIKSCSDEDDELFQTWTDVLISVLGHVNWTSDELIRVFELVDAHSSRLRVKSRELAARVLGSLSMSISRQNVTAEVLPRMGRLLSDTNSSVRGLTVEAFAFVGVAVPLEVVKQQVWPALLVLLNDEVPLIHAAALRSITHVCGHLRKFGGACADFVLNNLPPVFRAHIDFAREASPHDQRIADDDKYLRLEIVAECFGEMLFSCTGCTNFNVLIAESAPCFIDVATCNAPVVRRHCSYNLPGVALALGPSHYADTADLAVLTSRDTDIATRYSLAAGLSALAKHTCTAQTKPKLWTVTLALLRDAEPAVRGSVMEQLATVVKTLSSTGDFSTPDNFSAVLEWVADQSEGNWRTQTILAGELLLIAEFFAPSLLEHTILPLVLRMARQSVFVVRKAAMRTVAMCIRCIPSAPKRQKLVANLFESWGMSRIYWMRIGFLDACLAGAEFCSFSMTRALWVSGPLHLASDPVVNVRLALARSFHLLAPAVECYQIEYVRVIGMLKCDADEDVRESAAGLDAVIQKQLSKFENMDRTNLEREVLEETIHSRSTDRRTVELVGESTARADEETLSMESSVGSSQLQHEEKVGPHPRRPRKRFFLKRLLVRRR